MESKIKEFEESDYISLTELWKESGLKLSLSDSKEELEKLVFKNENKCFLLTRGEKIIGSVICANDGRRGYIHHVAISPEFQRLGYGKQLMEIAKEYYQSLNMVKVHIFIEKSNIEVVDFYKSLGWDVRDDIILMTQTLRTDG